jgi:hypothetical protein
VVSNGRAALINRSERTFESASVGCVKGQTVVEVVGTLVSVGNSNGWRPGASVSVLAEARDIERNQSNPDYRTLFPERKYCAEGLRVAVVGARADDGYEWSATGTPWPRDGEGMPRTWTPELRHFGTPEPRRELRDPGTPGPRDFE